MKTVLALFNLSGLLPLLMSCSSPPKPPAVDEAQKRPANVAIAVELQSCRSDLHNSRIQAHESSRSAEVNAATLAQLVERQKALAARSPGDQRNSIYSVLFAFGSSVVNVSDADGNRLVEEAKVAPLVMLRGRTDGVSETPAESRIARERAAAVRAYLVQAGVDPARIRTTWQPVGDPAADNSSASGRALNRRVEIEIYRTAPRMAAISSAPPTQPTL
jgi:outer membrane protein OmpA-like peptidoglycan-associated protein